MGRPRGLRRRSTAARLLWLWVRILPGAWMSVSVECCVLSGRGRCDGLITRPEQSYRLWCVAVCDLETSRMRRPWPALGRRATGNKNRWWRHQDNEWLTFKLLCSFIHSEMQHSSNFYCISNLKQLAREPASLRFAFYVIISWWFSTNGLF